mgnify:CR=1 FL=1
MKFATLLGTSAILFAICGSATAHDCCRHCRFPVAHAVVGIVRHPVQHRREAGFPLLKAGAKATKNVAVKSGRAVKAVGRAIFSR